MTGNARGKFIPANKFIKEDSRLPESILVQTVTGEYTAIHDELVGPMDTDMSLQPDPDTLRLLDDDDDLKEVLGPEIVKAYCAVKREELEAFNRVNSSWEREYLLLNV